MHECADGKGIETWKEPTRACVFLTVVFRYFILGTYERWKKQKETWYLGGFTLVFVVGSIYSFPFFSLFFTHRVVNHIYIYIFHMFTIMVTTIINKLYIYWYIVIILFALFAFIIVIFSQKIERVPFAPGLSSSVDVTSHFVTPR